MKKLFLFSMLVCLSSLSLLAQAGFNYQAVLRNSEGEILKNQDVGMRVSILEGSVTGSSVYTETFTPTTNDFGLVNLTIGSGDVELGDFSTINWSLANFFIKIELDAQGGSLYQEMGTSQLLSVPYANYAFASGSSSWTASEDAVTTDKKVGVGVANPTSKFQVSAAGGKLEEGEPIFEVKNSTGKTVFAIYENEVKVFIDESKPGNFSVNSISENSENEIFTVSKQETRVTVDTVASKSARGGFAVASRNLSKEGVSEDIMRITPEATQIFVKEPTAKSARGGFAVASRSLSKGDTVELMKMTPSFTRFYVDSENTKAARGGFAVASRNLSKTTIGEEIFMVTPNVTEVFIKEQQNKSSRGGFAVSGRSLSKVDTIYDVMRVTPTRTDIYVKSQNDPTGSGNLLPNGFAISSLDQNYMTKEYFSVSDSGTVISTPVEVLPVVKTKDVTNITQTTAELQGEVVANDYGIKRTGFIWNISGVLNLDIDFSDPSVAGIQYQQGYSNSVFTAFVNQLTHETTYRYRAFVENNDGKIAYGEIKTFTTQPPYNITFKVVDPISNEILTNATLKIQNYDSPYPIVGEQGQVDFKLTAGIYSITVIVLGREDGDNGDIQILNDNEIITLTPGVVTTKKRIEFHVKDTEGAWVQNASIVYQNGADQFDIPVSNGVGVGFFDPGTYTYDVTPSGNPYLTSLSAQTLTVTNDEIIEVVLDRKPDHSVKLTVKTQLAGAVVATPSEGEQVKIISSSNYVTLGEGITDADGVVYFDRVPEGMHQLTITSPSNNHNPYQNTSFQVNQNIDEEIIITN